MSPDPSDDGEALDAYSRTITQVAGAAIKGNLGGQIGPAITADGLSLVDNGWAIYWLGGNGSTFDGGGIASSVLNHNDTFSHTFTKAGTYHYICSIHPFMHGTVIVTA